MSNDVDPEVLLGRLRPACLGLPAVTERESHGAPTFFVQGKRAFVNAWVEGHHDHTFPHLWCAAPAGSQEGLIGLDPAAYFRPPYVGGRGWVGVRLDVGLPWDDVVDRCEEAYRAVAPARLVAELDAAGPPAQAP